MVDLPSPPWSTLAVAEGSPTRDEEGHQIGKRDLPQERRPNVPRRESRALVDRDEHRAHHERRQHRPAEHWPVTDRAPETAPPAAEDEPRIDHQGPTTAGAGARSGSRGHGSRSRRPNPLAHAYPVSSCCPASRPRYLGIGAGPGTSGEGGGSRGGAAGLSPTRSFCLIGRRPPRSPLAPCTALFS